MSGVELCPVSKENVLFFGGELMISTFSASLIVTMNTLEKKSSLNMQIPGSFTTHHPSVEIGN